MRTSLLTLALVLALPAAALAQSPSARPDAGADHLREAVALLPPGADSLGFTDWSRIRASLGAEDVTGDSPIDEKVAVVGATNEQEAAASGFGAAYLRTHRDTWGWDTLDVDWEAIFSGDGVPVSVVRLREGTDVAAIAARYDERGFTTEDAPSATIRSHALDPGADWIRSGELAVTNTAFLDDGRTLMFASSVDALREALGGTARAPVPGQAAVVGALEGASAAWLVLAPGCADFTPLPLDPLDPDASVRPLATGGPLHPWTALGIGYARPGWDPIGRVVMGFLDPTSAAADLGARTELARTAVSLFSGRPYAETVLAVQGSRVDGPTIVLDVAPADDRPTRLFQAVMRRDLPFAGC